MHLFQVVPRPGHIQGSWVTAIQAQLPGSSPCGGCKSKRLYLACMLSMALLKLPDLMRSSWVPVGPWAFSLAFYPWSPMT